MMVTVPLYVRVMGDSWLQVAEPVRLAHSTRSITRARGRLRIRHGPHYLARVLGRRLGLPAPEAAAATQLPGAAGPDGERWQRSFNGRGFTPRQYYSNGSRLT